MALPVETKKKEKKREREREPGRERKRERERGPAVEIIVESLMGHAWLRLERRRPMRARVVHAGIGLLGAQVRSRAGSHAGCSKL